MVNPTGFPSFPWPEPGGKGGGDFLFKAPKGPLFGSPLPARRRSPPQRIFFLLLFLLEAIALFVRKQKGKPEESKTVRQWALLGRIPIDALKPNYIWETQTDGPVTVYYHEKNTREMTEEEKADFLADQKGYGQRYLQMIIQEKKRLKRA